MDEEVPLRGTQRKDCNGINHGQNGHSMVARLVYESGMRIPDQRQNQVCGLKWGPWKLSTSTVSFGCLGMVASVWSDISGL